MRIEFHLLRLHCRQGLADTIFSSGITYFWGQTGVGKSSIPKLMDYCLAGDFPDTPAIQQEVLRVELHLSVENYNVILQREKGSSRILVSFKDKNSDEWRPALAPVKPVKGSAILPDKPDVESLSDLIFHLAGHKPPKVRQSRYREDEGMLRLSVRDLLWYCYLKQDFMDSSFFYLNRGEDPGRQKKSHDVMRLILGYHQESVSELENQLTELVDRRKTMLESSRQLEEMVEKSDIKNKESILNEISGLASRHSELERKITQLRDEIGSTSTHPLDIFKARAKELSQSINEVSKRIAQFDYKVEEQTKLFYEFVTGSFKVNRIAAANEILRGIRFASCPQCGLDISKRQESPDHCFLCNQSLTEIDPSQFKFVGEEFELKRKEIQNSIEDLKIERSQLGERLLGLQKEKSQVDSQIDEAQKAYNSRYLETILSLERERSRFDGQIYELKRVENLLALIEEYKNTYDLLATDEARIRRELNDAYANAERDKSSIRELEDLFLECLKRSKFPDIDENHFVTINTQDFLPRIKNRQNDIYQAQFANLGSGGKKTLFKACFAVAVHRFARRRNNPLFPSFLIIDGPMKNLSKNENPEIYQGFYEYVYELKAGELKDTQLIFVDSEFFKPNLENYPGLDVKEQQMMLDDPSHPRLIPGYRD